MRRKVMSNPSLQRRLVSALCRAIRMTLALGRGERGDRSGLEPAVLADIALLLAAFIERVASLAWSVRMPLAERRCEAVHRCSLMSAVLAVEVLHKQSVCKGQPSRVYRDSKQHSDNLAIAIHNKGSSRIFAITMCPPH